MKHVESIVLALITSVSLGVGTHAASEVKPPLPIEQGPVQYFEVRCARCHGPTDSPDNSAFEKPLTNPEIRKWVVDMAKGPGGQALAGEQLEAQVALHRAMIDHQVFLAWTGLKGQHVTGEVVPGASVSAILKKNTIKAKVEGMNWSLDLPKGVLVKEVVVVATKDKLTTKLTLAKAAFSHRVP